MNHKEDKDQPPKRNRRSEVSARRYGFIAFACWVAPLVVVLLLSSQARAQSSSGILSGIAAQGPSIVYPSVFLFVLAGLYGLYTASEAALEQLRPMHVRHFKESDARKAQILQQLIDKRPQYIAACNVGAFTTLTLLIIMCMIIAPTIGAVAEAQGVFTNYSALVAGAIIVTVPVTILTLIVGQIAPKSYALVHPLKTCFVLRGFMRVSAAGLGSPASIALSLASLITRRFGAKASFVLANPTEEEIKSLVEDAQQAGEIESDEKELFHSVFEFGETVAREVMTPRVDIDALPMNCSVEDMVKLIETSGHSRIPLYEGTDDQIVGIVHAKDLLKTLASSKPVNLTRLMRLPLFVPENKKLLDLLAEMRQTKSQLAVVQDEFGGTAGLVTIEDIVEELVGDIVDEYDEDEQSIVRESDGSVVVDGMMHVDDVNYAITGEIQSEEFDTIGGYVFGLFGRQPNQGDSVQDESYQYCVVDTDGRRISRVKILAITKQSSEEIAESL